MSDGKTARVITAIVAAIAIFLIAVALPRFLSLGVLPRLATTQGAELLLSLLAVMVFGKARFSEYGFCLPGRGRYPGGSRVPWVQFALAAPLLGMVASPLIFAFGGRGNPAARDLNFPQIVLFVWILSSVIEEVFTRGFLQGHLSVLSGRYVKVLFVSVELPVLISALFFGCMHFVLLGAGIDAPSMAVTFLFTTSLGLMAGYLRARTGSLVPAIAAHILANVGGAIGGGAYMLVRFMVTGKSPGI